MRSAERQCLSGRVSPQLQVPVRPAARPAFRRPEPAEQRDRFRRAALRQRLQAGRATAALGQGDVGGHRDAADDVHLLDRDHGAGAGGHAGAVRDPTRARRPCHQPRQPQPGDVQSSRHRPLRDRYAHFRDCLRQRQALSAERRQLRVRRSAPDDVQRRRVPESELGGGRAGSVRRLRRRHAVPERRRVRGHRHRRLLAQVVRHAPTDRRALGLQHRHGPVHRQERRAGHPGDSRRRQPVPRRDADARRRAARLGGEPLRRRRCRSSTRRPTPRSTASPARRSASPAGCA